MKPEIDAGTVRRLLTAAQRAARRAYAPYSGFPVGAAVLTAGGKVYSGANVENGSYGLTVCAERIAVFKAVNAGVRQIKAILVYTPTDNFTPPCGACLQVLSEFANEAVIILACRQGTRQLKLSNLLPLQFRLK
ncbi:MAG: cytidine deaminase [candidate division WOR-3 bacterium]|nr:cytidine deaminase [candidate division WOR-3 bacterium]